MRVVRLVALLLLLGTGVGTAGMEIEIGEDRLIGTGITPGGSAVWLAVEWSQSGWYPSVDSIAEETVDRVGIGTVELLREHAVSSRSVWFMVDTATGEFVGETQSGFEYSESSTSPVTFSEHEGCTVAVVESHEVVELLLVRPTDPQFEEPAAWHGEVGDGAPSDRDGTSNGVIQVCFADLVPLGEGQVEAPSAVRAGDTVVVIDSETLECRATHVESGF